MKVADYYDLPDCETYQQADEGVACVPEKAGTHNSTFRAANYPAAAINPKNPNEIDVTFASYINRHSNERNGCVPQGYNPDTFQPLYTGVKKQGACNNDVLLSRSTDGGKTFTGQTTNVRVLPSVRGNDPHADQFWQWAAFDPLEQPRGLLLRPRLRHGREDGLLGHQPDRGAPTAGTSPPGG